MGQDYSRLLQRDSAAKKVKQCLLDRIMDGSLKPGERLVELQLAKEMAVSQGPVREALCELEALGLVVTQPYRGSHVREVSQEETNEAYMVRAALEELAGQLAAPKLKGSTKALAKIAAAVLAAAEKNQISEFVRHNTAFHRYIVEATGNHMLLRTWDSLAFEVRTHRRLEVVQDCLVEVQKIHWKILEALDAGDGARSGKLLRKHVLLLLAKV